MKKLMLAGVVALAAMCSNAALVKWKATNVYDPDGEVLAGKSTYTAYLFTTAAADYDWSTVTTPEGLAAQLAKGAQVGLTDNGKAQPSDGIAHDSATLANLELAANKSYDFYLVVTDGATAFYQTQLFEDQTISPLADDLTSLTFNSQSARTQKGSESYVGWTSVNAPEPTSGLLLLLGVAGLALRRRRA